MTFGPMQANRKSPPRHETTSSRSIKLTPRKAEITRGLLAAKTNKSIAEELGISEQSVKNRLQQRRHVGAIRQHDHIHGQHRQLRSRPSYAWRIDTDNDGAAAAH